MQTMLRLTGDLEFSFQVSTAAYHQYVSTCGSRWPEQERLGREPALQHVGWSQASITLDGVVYPGVFASFEDSVKKIRALSLATSPFQLVAGTGLVRGFWAVPEVSDTRTIFLDDGRPRKIEFSIKLLYYGPDYHGASASVSTSALGSPVASVSGTTLAAAQGLKDLPTLNEASSLAEVTSVAKAAGTLVQQAAAVAQDVIGYINNPLELVGLAANVIPTWGIVSDVQSVAQAARAVLDVGDQVFDTVSAVTALPYTSSGTGQQRVNDIVNTLRQNLVHVRDKARVTGFGMDTALRSLSSTANTFALIPERAATADVCRKASEQADTMGGLCRGLEQTCGVMLEKFL